MSDTLYDDDFVTWTERQADALRQAGRAGSNLSIDFENLAEEIEDLGKEVRHKIESLTFRITVHLPKLACSPFEGPRAKRRSEVDGFRVRLAKRPQDNPSLEARFPEIVKGEFSEALRLTQRNLAHSGEEAGSRTLERWRGKGFSAEQILVEDFLPEAGDLPGPIGRN